MEAFDGLKQALTTAPVLSLPDPKLPQKLVTDSCGLQFSCRRVDQLHSTLRKIVKAENNCVNHEQILLAVIASLKVFRCYLIGEHFALVTDNMPNTYLEHTTYFA